MSNQLHRRLAYRTGEGSGTDVSTSSFWDTADLSTVRVYSHLEVYQRYLTAEGSGTVNDPWRASSPRVVTKPACGVGHSLFLGSGTDPVVVYGRCSSAPNLPYDYGTFGVDLDYGSLLRSFSFIGRQEDSVARSKINGNLDNLASLPGYCNDGASADYYNTRAVSRLVTATATCDPARMHWYFLQTSNSVGNFYTNGGYVPFRSPATTTPTRTTVNVPSDYGLRILHVRGDAGDFYPLEQSTRRMMTSFARPGTYYYGADGRLSDDKSWGRLPPLYNRELWDFSLKALRDGDMSPAGYFTGGAPIAMQVVDGGTKMFFLSITKGQSLYCRNMTMEFDIRTLSAAYSTRDMTDFQPGVNEMIGRPSTSSIPWTWFKFDVTGRKLLILSVDGVLAKFALANAYDLSTLSLVTAVILPASEYTGSGVTFESAASKVIPVTYTGQTTNVKAPITAADVDAEGQTLLISVGLVAEFISSSESPPMASRLVQYRL